MFSEACERNKVPIGDALARFIATGDGSTAATGLEIGSGTGQHAEYFSQRFSHVYWQPSDVAENLSHLNQRLCPLFSRRCLRPIIFDLNAPPQLHTSYDFVFTANTLHIVSAELVATLIQVATSVMKAQSHFLCMAHSIIVVITAAPAMPHLIRG